MQKKATLNLIFCILIKKPLLYMNKKLERKNAQNSKMLSNISKKRFLANFKSPSDDVISFAKLAKKSWRHFVWQTFFIYLFYLIHCNIMMRSIFKLTLKPTVAVNNTLKTGILTILSLISCDIQKLWSV